LTGAKSLPHFGHLAIVMYSLSLMMMSSVCPQSGHLDSVEGILVRSFARSVMPADPLND
jgi:hypothetical protein